jgi:hypothetical protein
MQFFVIDFLDELGHSEHFILKRWNLGPDPSPLSPSLNEYSLGFVLIWKGLQVLGLTLMDSLDN